MSSQSSIRDDEADALLSADGNSPVMMMMLPDDEDGVSTVADDATTNALPDEDDYDDSHKIDDVMMEGPDFEVNQQVYAHDGQLQPGQASEHLPLYPGTVQRIRRDWQNNVWLYLIHYKGWNSRWDQWMDSNSIFHDNDETRALVQTSAKRDVDDPTTTDTSRNVEKKRPAADAETNTAATASVNNRAAGKRRKVESENRTVAAATAARNNLFQEACELPFTLKTVLVEERERMTRSSTFNGAVSCMSRPLRQVHQLPPKVSVRQVLQHFIKKQVKVIAKREAATTTAAAAAAAAMDAMKTETPEKGRQVTDTSDMITVARVETFVEDMLHLFQQALPKVLLYPQERPQFDELQKNAAANNTSWAELYPCEYLLRLVVQLPVLVRRSTGGAHPHAKLDDDRITATLISSLLVLLQKNRQACFPGQYRYARPKEWLAWERQCYAGDVNGENARTGSTTHAAAAMDTNT